MRADEEKAALLVQPAVVVDGPHAPVDLEVRNSELVELALISHLRRHQQNLANRNSGAKYYISFVYEYIIYIL